MQYSSETSFNEAIAKENDFKNFFRSVGTAIRNIDLKTTNQSWNEKDHALSETLLKSKRAIKVALCDSFDTKTAVNELCELISSANVYLS